MDALPAAGGGYTFARVAMDERLQHPPADGLTHDAAAEVLAALMTESLRLGLSGIGLEDTGAALPSAAG